MGERLPATNIFATTPKPNCISALWIPFPGDKIQRSKCRQLNMINALNEHTSRVQMWRKLGSACFQYLSVYLQNSSRFLRKISIVSNYVHDMLFKLVSLSHISLHNHTLNHVKMRSALSTFAAYKCFRMNDFRTRQTSATYQKINFSSWITHDGSSELMH